MNKLIKVDRVSSVDEALELENLGVDIIGVSISEDVRFSDKRYLDLKTIISIRKALKTSNLVVEIPANYENISELIDMVSPQYIQISGLELLNKNVLSKIDAKGLKVIYTGIEASHDDDPTWILSRYKDSEVKNVKFYHIDLFGDIEDSWRFLINESPNFPDELQLSDIENLGQKSPLLLSLDFNKSNVFEILKSFPSIKGINLIIAEKANREDIHFFSYQSVLDILRVIAHE